MNKDKNNKVPEAEGAEKSFFNIFSVGDRIALAAILIGIIFNIFQLQSTKASLQQSQASLDILANKEGVHLEPVIGIDARMQKNIELFGSPKLYIFNNGKIPAINVVVQIIRREFNGNEFVGVSWGTGNGSSAVFDEIKTYETKEVVLREVDVTDPNFNVIEVRIHYMRDYDKRSYSLRTFYFYGPEGSKFKSWTNIKQAKLMGEPFAKVIEESLNLPVDIVDEDFEKRIGSELYEL